MSSQEQTQTPQFGEENKIRLFGTRNGQIQTDCDDKDGRIALNIACLFGNADNVQDLLEERALINTVATCQAAVVYLLLEYKAKVNVRNSEGQTPLAILVTAAPERQGTTAWKTIMQRLIAGGSDLEARVEPSGYTPLTLAASRGCVDIMEQLLEAGANTAAQDSNNWTALFQAVSMGNPRMVKLLLDHKAKPDPLDEQQGTPLEYAVALGIHPPVFFQKTEIFDMRDGHYNIAQQILETRPLNHDPQDRFGRSLTWWIQLTGHTRMRDLLTDYGMQLGGDGQEQQGWYQLGMDLLDTHITFQRSDSISPKYIIPRSAILKDKEHETQHKLKHFA
ncbi:hypothetical protein APSETT444_010118 [Aspergillus pseudonomiae]